MTLVFFGSLASVRSPETVFPHRLSGFIVHVAALLFFLLKLASTVLRACPDSGLFLLGAISSFSIEVVGDCPIVPPTGFAFKPARVASHHVALTRHVKTHHDQSPLHSCGKSSASQSQRLETVCEDADCLFNLVAGFALRVCTCVIPDCTHRLVSRETIVVAEQIMARRF